MQVFDPQAKRNFGPGEETLAGKHSSNVSCRQPPGWPPHISGQILADSTLHSSLDLAAAWQTGAWAPTLDFLLD